MLKKISCNNEEPKIVFFFFATFSIAHSKWFFVRQALHWHSLRCGSSILWKLVHLVICHNVNKFIYFPFLSKIFEIIIWDWSKTYHKIHEVGNPNPNPTPLWTLKIPNNGNFNWPTWLQWSSWQPQWLYYNLACSLQVLVK